MTGTTTETPTLSQMLRYYSQHLSDPAAREAAVGLMIEASGQLEGWSEGWQHRIYPTMVGIGRNRPDNTEMWNPVEIAVRPREGSDDEQ